MSYGLNGESGDCVPHDFRSSFRDWTGEVTSYPRDVAEMALAHSIDLDKRLKYPNILKRIFEKEAAPFIGLLTLDSVTPMVPVRYA